MFKGIFILGVSISLAFADVTDGAFNFNLGDNLNQSEIIRTVRSNNLWTTYKVKHNNIGKLTYFYVTVGKFNGSIQHIYAESENYNMNKCFDDLKVIKKALVNKYGKFNTDDGYESKNHLRTYHVNCSTKNLVYFSMSIGVEDKNLERQNKLLSKKEKLKTLKNESSAYQNKL